MKYRVRPATVADLPLIVSQRHAMFEAMGYVNRAQLELTDAKFVEWVTDKLERGEYLGWFLADEGNRVVAGAGLWIMEWPPHAIDQSTRRGNILNVYAEPEYRDEAGLRRLLIQILDYCRDHGIRTVIVNPAEPVRPLFESLGFGGTSEYKIQVTVPN